MRKRSLILVCIIVILIFLYVKSNPFVSNTNLKDEYLAGIYLTQRADIQLLEKTFGKLTADDITDRWGGSLTFDNPPNYALVQIDKDNQVTKIVIAANDKSNKTKFTTNRNIGLASTLSDIQKAYGNNYYKKTHRNFMGSGEGYSITYVDREQNIALEFEFNDYPHDDRKEFELIRIELSRQVDKEMGKGLF